MLEMLGHRGDRLLRIAFSQGLDEMAVLFSGTIRLPGMAIGGDDQGTSCDQFIDKTLGRIPLVPGGDRRQPGVVGNSRCLAVAREGKNLAAAASALSVVRQTSMKA